MNEPRTLPDVFAIWRSTEPQPELIDARTGRDARVSAAAAARSVAGIAQGLAKLGVRKGDRVAIISGNRPEWHMIDFAVNHLGAADVPIYPTLLPAQVGGILKDSGAKLAIVETAELLAKVLEVRASCPSIEHVLLIEGEPPVGVKRFADHVIALDQVAADKYLEERRAQVEPGDLATLIYTSGTTGEPKGAMLTNDNFVFNATRSAKVMPWPKGGELALSFLPLSHVLERLVGYIYFLKGSSIAYCPIPEVGDTLRRLHPDLFTAVPRVYEKVYDKIFEESSHAPKLKRAIFKAAVDVALKYAREGKRGLAYRLFDALVYKKIRHAVGGNLRFTISGGAPLPVFVGEFFHGVGLKVLEGYGLTETSPVIAVNPYDRPRLGTVGNVIPEVEVKIASDGEILTRGRHVMKGYWNKPEATAAAIDKDGWFATGDIGELSPDGYLRITDRKKDILVTAGGKNVAPQPIENDIKASPLVENVVLFGDRKPFVVAFLVPNFEELVRWAARKGLPVDDRMALLDRPEVHDEYQRVINGVNASLARYESVKKFRLLSKAFSLEGGELTPTLKVKRRVIEKRFAALIEEMYREGSPEAGKGE